MDASSSFIFVGTVGEALLSANKLPSQVSLHELARFVNLSDKELADFFGGDNDSFIEWRKSIASISASDKIPEVTERFFPGAFSRRIPSFKIARIFAFCATYPEVFSSLPYFFPYTVEYYRDLRVKAVPSLKSGDLDHEVGALAGVSAIQAWRWRKHPELKINPFSMRLMQMACYLLFIESSPDSKLEPCFEDWLSYCKNQMSID